MTTTKTAAGRPLHFPATIEPVDASGVIVPPPPEALPEVAQAVAPGELLLFAQRLVRSARKKRHHPRWGAVNASKIALAGMCLDRVLADDAGKAMRPALRASIPRPGR
jgi:hypothetical protein